MNFCSKCGAKLNEENKCINCNANIVVTNNEVNKENSDIKVINAFSKFPLVLFFLLILVVFGTIIIMVNAKIGNVNRSTLSLVLGYVYVLIPIVLVYVDKSQKYIKKSKVTSWISFCLAFIPLLPLLYYCISGLGENIPDYSLIVFVIYSALISFWEEYWAFVLPIELLSFIYGIISYRSKKNKLALSSMLLAFLPLLLTFLSLLSYIIFIYMFARQ